VFQRFCLRNSICGILRRYGIRGITSLCTIECPFMSFESLELYFHYHNQEIHIPSRFGVMLCVGTNVSAIICTPPHRYCKHHCCRKYERTRRINWTLHHCWHWTRCPGCRWLNSYAVRLPSFRGRVRMRILFESKRERERERWGGRGDKKRMEKIF
jgi:hypothetical protein